MGQISLSRQTLPLRSVRFLRVFQVSCDFCRRVRWRTHRRRFMDIACISTSNERIRDGVRAGNRTQIGTVNSPRAPRLRIPIPRFAVEFASAVTTRGSRGRAIYSVTLF